MSKRSEYAFIRKVIATVDEGVKYERGPYITAVIRVIAEQVLRDHQSRYSQHWDALLNAAFGEAKSEVMAKAERLMDDLPAVIQSAVESIITERVRHHVDEYFKAGKIESELGSIITTSLAGVKTDHPWLTTTDVAARLGVTQATARRIIKNKLRHAVTMIGNSPRVSNSALEEWINSQQEL